MNRTVIVFAVFLVAHISANAFSGVSDPLAPMLAQKESCTKD